jgi:hypothetical protein
VKYKSLEERAADRRARPRAPAREEEPKTHQVFVDGRLLPPTSWWWKGDKLHVRLPAMYPKSSKIVVYEVNGIEPLNLTKANVVIEVK